MVERKDMVVLHQYEKDFLFFFLHVCVCVCVWNDGIFYVQRSQDVQGVSLKTCNMI